MIEEILVYIISLVKLDRMSMHMNLLTVSFGYWLIAMVKAFEASCLGLTYHTGKLQSLDSLVNTCLSFFLA